LSESVVITPEGELDYTRIDEFRNALSQADAAAVAIIVDLTAVSFIDSSGLGALVDLHNRVRRENRLVAVVAPGGTAAAVLLNLSGLQTRIPIFPTVEAALAGSAHDGSMRHASDRRRRTSRPAPS
jgi:anti-sigma B factor antagonist